MGEYMTREMEEYQKYLLNFGVVEKPKMPKFNCSAYTDIEYLSEIFALQNDFDKFDDEYLALKHLKGE